MKVLSLQWRITLMTVLLIGVTCVSMNLLLCSSGVYYMDSIADSLQDYDHIAVESGETAGFDPQLIPPGEGLTIVVSGAQARFRTTNWYITAAIALLGGMLAYFVSGHALRPLRRFAQQTEQVETSNLSEIRLDEETLPELRSRCRFGDIRECPASTKTPRNCFSPAAGCFATRALYLRCGCTLSAAGTLRLRATPWRRS